jgi:hypothetical protein
MSNRSAKEMKAEAVGVLTGMLPMLDSANPCDNALKLVSLNIVLCCLFFTKKTLMLVPGLL